jgi:hypothetical protein
MSPLPLQPPPFTAQLLDRQGLISPLWSRFFTNLPIITNTDLAPATATFWITTANPRLPQASNLGALTNGFLVLTVVGGVATPSTTLDGSDLTDLNASELTSGTVPDAVFPSSLPALNGSLLTDLTGTNVTHQVSQIDTGDSPYTVIATDEYILADAASGAITITLPSPVSGRLLTVKKIDSSGNAVTLNAGAASIDGSSTKVLAAQWDAARVLADAAAWFVVAEV